METLKVRTLKALEMKNFFIKKIPPEKGRGKEHGQVRIFSTSFKKRLLSVGMEKILLGLRR